MEKGYKKIPILRAILFKDYDEALKLISADQTLVNMIHKKSGDSPLIVASRLMNKEIVKLLLENGANIEHKNLDGKQAIHEAASCGSQDILEQLISRKADVDALKRADWTPLMFACVNGHLKCAAVLVEYGASCGRMNKDGWTPFHLACREGHLDIVKYLLTVDGKSYLKSSKNLRTPLHTSCMHGQMNVCQQLIDLPGIDIRAKDSCGSTPALDSIRFNFIDITKMLVEKSPDCLKDQDNLGKSAIHIAAQSGHCDALQYLHNDCCWNDINQSCGNAKMTPLHYAAKEGNIEALRYIMSLVDTVDCFETFGRTPLHLSVASNKLFVVPMILSAGADCEIKDSSGKYPVDYALSDKMKTLLNSF